MFKKILVALDGSEPGRHAFDAAVSLAKAQDAELVLLHTLLRTTPLDVLYDIVKQNDLPESVKDALDDVQVIPSTTAYGAAAGTAYVVVPDKALCLLAESYLSSAEKIAQDAGVTKISTHIADGQPADEILAHVQNDNADLIILGSRGLGDLKSLFLGSVSHKVVQESPVPCMIVK